MKMNWKTLLCPDRIRPYSSSGSDDLRSEFEKDYHRIIVSASFRRLQDKTQVFPLDQSDFIRTRLTHSLEVSSVARSLGQNIAGYLLQSKADPEFTLQTQSDMCSILQCAGLIHDIGNPPFGHFGETTIREWFQENLPKLEVDGKPVTQILNRQMEEDLLHFEGNAQALRQVTRLHFLVDENGMNLTYGLLGAMIKYPAASDEVQPEGEDIRKKKMGYFLADKEIFDKIQTACGTDGCRHPLSFILEAADDIAYLTADLEDGYQKGYLSYHRLLEELYADEVLEKLKGEERKAYLELAEKLEKRYESGRRRHVADPESYAVSNWIMAVQGFLLNCATEGFVRNYREIMDGKRKKDLFAGTAGEVLHEVCGNIAWKNVFVSKPIYRLELSAATVLHYLMEKFTDAVLYYDTEKPLTDLQEKRMVLISENYKYIYHLQAAGKTEAEKLYLRLLLVMDYICSMTDSYAKRLYQDLNGSTNFYI